MSLEMSEHLQEKDSEMIGESSFNYDIDHLLCRASEFPGEGFDPSEEVRILRSFLN